MARDRRYYKLPNSSSGGLNWPYWLASLLLLGVIGWIWFRTGKHALIRKSSPSLTQPQVAPSNRPSLRPVVVTAPAFQPSAGTQTQSRTEARITPTSFPRLPQNTFEAQVALVRRAISPGSLDGVLGPQTRAALQAFQRSAGLPLTGMLDKETRARLTLDTAPLTGYRVGSNDLAQLQPVADTWLGKSRQSALDYETILELVAEKTHSHPGYIRTLNPGVDWVHVAPGTELRVPNAMYPEPVERAAFVRIFLAARTLEVFGANSNLLAHFPCSIAQQVEKRPVGKLHVAAIAPNPNYTFNPEVFPESAEAQAIGRKLILPPGPNNPVGVAWISLDRPGYGIHGTPSPEQIGRTESHGCFRLANWNAEHLLKLVSVGTAVFVEP